MIAKPPHPNVDHPFDDDLIPELAESAKKHYAAVGRVASGWSNFESSLVLPPLLRSAAYQSKSGFV